MNEVVEQLQCKSTFLFGYVSS